MAPLSGWEHGEEAWSLPDPCLSPACDICPNLGHRHGGCGRGGHLLPRGSGSVSWGGGEHTASRPRAGLAASTLLLANVCIKLLWDWLPILGDFKNPDLSF